MSTPDWQGEVGILDATHLRILLDRLDAGRSVAMLRGPGQMVTAVSDALLDLGFPMRSVVYERFDYPSGAARRDRRRSRHFAAIGGALAAGVAAFALASG